MSGLIYERGNPAQPAGHAFLYFGHRGDQQVLATYIVVPPIIIDLAKYMPPMFASNLAGLGSAQAAFLPIPPVPEPIELGQILGLAELRNDDILVAPPAPGSEATALLPQVIEVGEAYAESYRSGLQVTASGAARPTATSTETEAVAAPESPSVRAMLYATVSENERLDALARELSRIRFGLELGDRAAVESALAEMRAIATSLPDKFRAHELIEVAARNDTPSVRLTQLYLERGYRLCREAYEELPPIEAEIALLQHEIERPR